MVLADSTAHQHAVAHSHGHQTHPHHHEETKNYADLEAQFFEYNQISDAFSSVGFTSYDLLHNRTSHLQFHSFLFSKILIKKNSIQNPPMSTVSPLT